MAKSQLKTTLPWDVQKVWQMVTDAEGYSWRSDLSRVEVLDGTRFIEYGTDGTATAFTVTRSEPYHRWEFRFLYKGIIIKHNKNRANLH